MHGKQVGVTVYPLFSMAKEKARVKIEGEDHIRK